MISVETLQLCRQILATATFTATADDIEEAAVRVATAKRELDEAIEAALRS